MKTCRGCAGTGVGQHVSPRTIAVLETISYTWTIVPIGLSTRRKIRTIIVGRVGVHAVNLGAPGGLLKGETLPLAEALKKVDALFADGFRYHEESAAIPLDQAWLCEWCHGTGTPQLSIGTMQAVTR